MSDHQILTSRRKFLKQCAGTALGVPFGFNLLQGSALADMSFGDYKALVCIYQYGGADTANMLVPYTQSAYNEYAAIRGALAVPRETLLPLGGNFGQAAEYALHPSFAPLHTLFQSGRLALVANVGSLLQPTTRAQILSGDAVLPPQLFSHSDQTFQWATSISDSQVPVGWGGRIADLFGAVNGAESLPVNISLDGHTVLLAGEQCAQYTLSPYGAEGLAVLGRGDNETLVDQTVRNWMTKSYPNMLQREFARVQGRAVRFDEEIRAALDGLPEIGVQFPDDYLGEQLHMVARMIQARNQLGTAPVRRQMFMVASHGWDTHDAEAANLPVLFQGLADGMRAFHDAMVSLGVSGKVTTFTSSEFGRTLTNNGDGTDHGWGGHHLVLGGAVHGGTIYGTLPELALEGSDDAGDGRIIPSLSTSQFNATLASWFGVPDVDLDVTFPHLSRFAQRNIGFV